MSQENQNKFQIGDTVTWTSQAGGNAKTKTGKVVVIIDAGQWLDNILAVRNGRWAFEHLGIYSTRDHESYLIQVGKSKRLYWPLVKYLKPWAEVRQCTPEEIIQREKEGWRDNPDYQEPQW